MSYAPCTDHLGNEFPSMAAMCRHWGVGQDTFRSRLGRGVPLADALMTPAVQNATPCVDHLGNEFPTQKAMCEHWGVKQSSFCVRLSRGFSLSDALTTPVAKMALSCVDHLGNEFPSKAAMCRHWGVNQSTFENRVGKGLSLSDALAEPLSSRGHSMPCTDHLGNEFPSVSAMCRHWGVNLATFRVRLGKGIPLADALTTPVSPCGHGMPCVDHLGNEFPSEAAMCRHWGVSQNTFENRLGKGIPLADALTTPSAGKATNCTPCVDHLGNEFPTQKAMCEHWGISQSTFRFRLSKGVPLADALATPSAGRATRCKPCTDHLGNKFPSMVAMCRHWGISFVAYKNRQRMGWDLERVLTEPVSARGEDPSSS